MSTTGKKLLNAMYGEQGTGRSLFHEMYMADCVLSITRNRENPHKQFVRMDKNRYTGETGDLDPEEYNPNELAALLQLFLWKKNDPKYKEQYDKLMFTYSLCEQH